MGRKRGFNFGEKGLFFAYEFFDVYGLSFGLLYIGELEEIQLTFHIFTLSVAVGWRF